MAVFAHGVSSLPMGLERDDRCEQMGLLEGVHRNINLLDLD